MAASDGSNSVFATVANQLQSLCAREEPEVLFQKAVSNVHQRNPTNRFVTHGLSQLKEVKEQNDVIRLLWEERAHNSLWKERNERSFSSIISRVADNVLIHRKEISLMLSNHSIGGPVWGAVAFILGVWQDIEKTGDLLKELRKCLLNSAERFGEYYEQHKIITGSLRTALIEYYESIIEFSISLLREFERKGFKVRIAAVQRTLKTELEEFDRKIWRLIDNVDKSYLSRSLNSIQSSFQNAAPLTMPLTAPVVPLTCYSLPQLLNKCFTGRRDVLENIWQALQNNCHSNQTQVALWGIGGIGKTQILLKYAHDRRSEGFYNYIFFIRANAKETVDVEILAIIDSLGLKDHTIAQNFQLAVAKFKDWLRKTPKWLLIFDNVGDLTHVSHALPNASHGHILFSARSDACASMLVDGGETTNSIEVLPLPDPDSQKLVEALAQHPSLELNRTPQIATEVSAFVGGLPLAIEQFVNNARFSGRSLADTLQRVKEKKTLLEQQNLSSLHEDNMSVGAIVVQTVEDLKRRDECAAALFQIMCYLEPSSIALSMIRDGGKLLQEYLTRTVTYDRGQIRRPGQVQALRKYDADIEEPFCLWDHDPWSKEPWKRLLHVGHYKKRYTMTDLPKDMTQGEIELRDACMPEKTLGRLFKSTDNVDDAIKVIQHAALVRLIDPGHVWIHDLFSQLGRALTEVKSQSQNRLLAQAATTLVYLTYPIPSAPSVIVDKHNCWHYFPHGVACHSHLKQIGILNNTPLGPELSHLIASTLCERQPFDIRDNIKIADQSREIQATSYYREALLGYATAAVRLRVLPGVNEQRVIFSTVADFIREDNAGYLPSRHLWNNERFGRSAPWRYLQTLSKLASLLSRCVDTQEEAIKLFTSAISHVEAMFGSDHPDTLNLNERLLRVYFDRKQWGTAYSHIQKYMETIFVKEDASSKSHPKRYLLDSMMGAEWADYRAWCCLNIEGKEIEAVQWLEIVRKYRARVFGKDDYSLAIIMHRLGIAYEKLQQLTKSFYWRGSAVLCYIDRIGARNHTMSGGIMIGSLFDQEQILEAIRGFENVRERVKPFEEQWMNSMDSAVSSGAVAYEVYVMSQELVDLKWEFVESEAAYKAEHGDDAEPVVKLWQEDLTEREPS